MRAGVSARLRDRRAVLVVPSFLVAAGLFAGCSGQADDPDPSVTSTTSSSASPTPSPSPTVTTPPPTATSTPTPSPTRPPGLAGRLLRAADVPPLSPGARWTAVSTEPESPSSSFGTCQRFSTLAIGAERALVRRYRLPGGNRVGGSAGELVAQLPDAATARRAYAVLTAWRARCADRLRHYARPSVGALQDVSVPGGSAGWYLLRYGPGSGQLRAPAGRYADAQGMVVVGDRLAMVTLRTTGSAAGVTKAMPVALRSAARLLP